MAKIDFRKEARGRECQVKIAKQCSGQETTVLAHIPNKSLVGAGMGMKPHDIFGSHCCSACHDIVDGRAPSQWNCLEVRIAMYEGVLKTQNILLKEGKIGELK